MADTPHKTMTPAAYDARLLQASWDIVERSRELLAQTKPLLTSTEGGSVIGGWVHLGECDRQKGMP